MTGKGPGGRAAGWSLALAPWDNIARMGGGLAHYAPGSPGDRFGRRWTGRPRSGTMEAGNPAGGPGPGGPRMITIELFGVPRLRAGTRLVALEAGDVGSALLGLGRACPGLEGSVLRSGRVHPGYKLSLNGDAFVTEPSTALADGDVLLLLAADVGG